MQSAASDRKNGRLSCYLSMLHVIGKSYSMNRRFNVIKKLSPSYFINFVPNVSKMLCILNELFYLYALDSIKVTFRCSCIQKSSSG